MDKTFEEINERSKEVTWMYEQYSRLDWRSQPLEGRHRFAKQHLKKLWSFLYSGGWTPAMYPSQSPEGKTANGWCMPTTQEIYVKPTMTLGNQLYVLLHESVHAIDAWQLGPYGFIEDPAFGGVHGAEVRAETVAAMVTAEISKLQPCVEKASKYISIHNFERPLFASAQFPEAYEKRIKIIAESLLEVVTQ